MKKSMKCKSWMLLAMAAVSTLGFQSCLDDDDDHYAYQVMVPNAIVTVKTTAEDDFFLQLDDTTTLLPVNITTSPFGKKEVRALTNFTPVDQPTGGYTQAVHVNWIDSILTKSMAPDLGLQNDSVYGTDPVEIVNDWVTIAEDGYLTLRFRTSYRRPIVETLYQPPEGRRAIRGYFPPQCFREQLWSDGRRVGGVQTR